MSGNLTVASFPVKEEVLEDFIQVPCVQYVSLSAGLDTQLLETCASIISTNQLTQDLSRQ